MPIADRLQRAAESQLGGVLFALLCGLVLLGCAYTLMIWRQRKHDLLAYLNRSFYEKAQRIAKAFSFIGDHHADFFGRVSSVRSGDRSYALCTIPPPNTVDEKGLLRYCSFMRAIHGQRLPLFAPHIWKHDNELLIVIQGKLIQHDGSSLSHLQDYLDDKRLGKAYTEQILLQIAESLAALHSLRAEEGSKLYHGMLLPRSLFLDFDLNRTINKIVIADARLAFAFGPKAVAERLERLQNGKLPIDKIAGNAMVEQMAMLAPEQKNPERIDTVGQAVDFYAYGALAVLMFTKKPFRGRGRVAWNAIPQQWRPFIKAALDDNPNSRPKDFLELQDWLTDPDLALTVHQSAGQEVSVEDVEAAAAETHELKDLAGILEQVQVRTQQVEKAQGRKNKKEKKLSLGINALKLGRWEKAKDHLLEAYSLDSEDSEISVSLAIASYELGDLDKAEQFYNEAKLKDPTTAKCFRDHIAFRI